MILTPVDDEWRGMALLLHGLNFKPTHMLPLANALQGMGIGVLNGALTGHGDNYQAIAGYSEAAARLETYRRVTLAQWLTDITNCYVTARQVAEAQRVPLFLVAFSMGALTACAAWASDRTIYFARAVLFAPAFAIHAYCHLPFLLKRWPRLLIRSFAPQIYRANRATPVAAYLAVQAAQRCFREQVDQRLNVPTQIFIGPHDELIARRGIEQLLVTHKLTAWQLDVVSKRNAAAGAGFHHLIVNEASVGRQEWERMMGKVQQTLLG